VVAAMSPEQWERVKEIYEAALERSLLERKAYVDEQAEDDVVRAEVLRLLSVNASLDSFLSTPPFVDRRLSYTEPPERLAQGQVLAGRFRVIRFIAAGGMGEVYKAEDLRLDRIVVLKFLPNELPEDGQSLERFRREAKAASALNHPSICTVYDLGEDAGRAFIAMEYVDGETLSARIEKGPLSVDETIKIAIALANALSAAHTKGIIHRDLKPSNIMLTNTGVKLLDFGLAKWERPTTSDEPTEESLATEAQIAGTLPYMSPEQLRGAEVDARSDVFSFGVVLYEMLTGRRAFQGQSRRDIVTAVDDEELSPSRKFVRNAPNDLERVIRRCLQKNPDDRYALMSEIVRELEDYDAADPSSTRFRWVAISGATILLVGLGIVGWLLHSGKTHPLTAKDTIVIADFTNTTGDPLFDGTLAQGLSVQLEQSPFLSIVSDEQVQQTLQMMGQKPDAKLTPAIAREVCQRTASAAVVDGSIVEIGTPYLLTLKAVNCSNGERLASTEAQANDKNHVLDALGKTATEMRSKLGESLASVQKFDTPLEQATTSSLEALQAFSLAVSKTHAGDFAAAVAACQRAISLDPNFVLAYAFLGITYDDLGESTLAAENLKKAYAMRDRVSERERFLISDTYYLGAIGDLNREAQIDELWAQAHPRDGVVFNQLGVAYGKTGQLDKSLAALLEATRLVPTSAIWNGNVAFSYIALNRLDEARAVIQQAQSRNVDAPFFRLFLYQIDFLQNDSAGMGDLSARSMGGPIEGHMLALESDTAAYSGQLSKANDLTKRAIESAVRSQLKENAAGYLAEAALREALFGNVAKVVHPAAEALQTSTDRYTQAWVALALALSRNRSQAERLADDLARRFPEDTVVRFYDLPMTHAAVALDEGKDSEAIDALQAATRYELAPDLQLYVVYVRGMAYLAAHKGALAAVEFQKILDHPGIVANAPIGSLVHLQIGRAYAMQGDTAKAKSACQDFLTLWKDADPDIPILKQAKAEYAGLQ
jgi:eukaryotic-like serine/threonine-protein kinase